MTKRQLTALVVLFIVRATSASGLSEVICTGDCNYDHRAAVDELISGVNIALGRASIDVCRSIDLDGNNAASIDELIGGVRNSLSGCPRARVQRGTCDFALPPEQDPAAVECGYAIVQEDRNALPLCVRNQCVYDGRTVRIPFAVFKATGPNPVVDPFVYLNGGPGGPTLDFVQFSIPGTFAPFQAQRDLIFFDQRGTGHSSPSLDCPEWRDAFATYLRTVQTVDEDAAALLAAMRTCHDRLVAEGVNLAAYTSSASAHDLEDLMVALGYQTWNLYGISYGTRLGATAIRDTPGHIRSVGLDSNVPVQENLEANFAADFERSLNTLFAGCAQDAACNATFPDLEQTFFTVVAEFNAHPVTLHPTNPDTGEPFDVVVTGDRLLLGVQQALYDKDLFPLLPLVVSDTARGDYTLLTVAAGLIAVPSSIAWGMYYSIECNEEVPFITPDIIAAAVAGVREEIKTVGVTYTTQLTADICAFWGSPAPPEIENAAVVSDLPVLVFAGEYDPITRPEYGQLVAQTLSHSSFFEFPGFGHGVLSPGCATEMVLAFLANPAQPPDGACIDLIPPPHFAGS